MARAPLGADHAKAQSVDDSECDHDDRPPPALARISWIHLHAEGRILVALKSFNDGSGKADCRATSLACAAMLEQFWYEFDNDWEKLLARHNLKCFHMTDAVALKNHFSKGNGWNKEKVRSLISEIVLILNRHQQRNMQFRCSTVLRNDYKRAKASHPTLRPIPAICANYTVGGLRVPK